MMTTDSRTGPGDKQLILFWFFFVLWVINILFLHPLNPLHHTFTFKSVLTPFVLIFGTPFVFLMCTLKFGTKIYKNSKLHTILLLTLLGIGAFFLFTLPCSNNSGGLCVFLLFIISVYLVMNFVFAGIFLLSRKIIHTVLIYGLTLGILFFTFSPITKLLYTKPNICTDSQLVYNPALTRIYFLEPQTKEDVVKLVRETNFSIRSILLNKYDNLKYDQFIMLSPSYTPETITESLKEYVAGPGYISSYQKQLIEEYDNNEPVVWGLDFYNPPLKDLIDKVYEMDVEDGKLGTRTGNQIVPPTETNPIWQSKCYDII